MIFSRNKRKPVRPLRFQEIKDKKKSKHKKLKALLRLICLLLFAWIFWQVRSYFLVKDIWCEIPDDKICQDQISIVGNQIQGKFILGKLSLTHPYLIIETKRSLPHTVRLIVTNPALLLTFSTYSQESEPYSLTKEGVKVPILGLSAHLPVIKDASLEMLSDGYQVESQVLIFYQTVLEMLAKQGSIKVTQILLLDSDQIIFTMEQNISAVMRREDFGKQWETLQMWLDSPTIEKIGKTIDLRFENPVVK